MPGQFGEPDTIRPEPGDDPASCRSANVLLWHAFSSFDSSTLVKARTIFTVTFGGRSRAIGPRIRCGCPVRSAAFARAGDPEGVRFEGHGTLFFLRFRK
jgi:hypothetical protein